MENRNVILGKIVSGLHNREWSYGNAAGEYVWEQCNITISHDKINNAFELVLVDGNDEYKFTIGSIYTFYNELKDIYDKEIAKNPEEEALYHCLYAINKYDSQCAMEEIDDYMDECCNKGNNLTDGKDRKCECELAKQRCR